MAVVCILLTYEGSVISLFYFCLFFLFFLCISLIHHNLYCARKYRIQLFYATASIPLCTEIFIEGGVAHCNPFRYAKSQ